MLLIFIIEVLQERIVYFLFKKYFFIIKIDLFMQM